VIGKKLGLEKDQLLKEIEIAKMILSNKELSLVANQRFKECIDIVNKEKLLQQDGAIKDLIEYTNA